MKEPSACASLEEVRAEIDRIDEQIISLVGRRAGYVQAAARFKTSASAVAAPERLAAMLKARRAWAEREGLSPEFVESWYRSLVAYFIDREREHWKARN